MRMSSRAHASSTLGSAGCQASTAQVARRGRGASPNLRGLLGMGARALLNAAGSKSDSISRWAVNIALRPRLLESGRRRDEPAARSSTLPDFSLGAVTALSDPFCRRMITCSVDAQRLDPRRV